jgi:hypothetical protein
LLGRDFLLADAAPRVVVTDSPFHGASVLPSLKGELVLHHFLPFPGWFNAQTMSSQMGADVACFRTTRLTSEGSLFRRRATLE